MDSFEGTKFLKTFFFKFFGHPASNFRTFVNIFNGVFRNAFYLNIKTSWWKKKFSFVGKKTKNRNLQISTETFSLLFVQDFWTFSKKLSAFCRKKVGGVVKTAIHLSIGVFLKVKKVLRKVVAFFVMVGHWVTFFQPVLESFSGGFQNLIQIVQKYILMKKWFFKKSEIFLKIFGPWAQNFRPFVENVSVGLSNLLFHVHRHLLKKSKFFEKNVILSFSDIEQKISGPLSKIPQRDLQNCFLFVKTNSLMNINFFWKVPNFFFFGWRVKKPSTFCRKKWRDCQNWFLSVYAYLLENFLWETL